MLDALASRLQNTFGRLGASGRISEADLDEALRDVRIALLEADVNFKVVRGFVERVRERATGQDVLKSITPRQQIIRHRQRHTRRGAGWRLGGTAAPGRRGRRR